MKLTGVGATKGPFALGWAIDAYWPGLRAIANGLGAAPVAAPSYRAGQSGNTVQANVGGTVSDELVNGRIITQMGAGGAFNEQVLLFPVAPRIKQPLAGSVLDPDSLMFWWEFTSQFQSPGASVLALWHGLRVCTSAATNQWSANAIAAVGGVGFGVGLDGAGALRLYTKRLNAVGAAADLGGIAPPSGMVATDPLRWGYALLAATPSRAARVRLYLNSVLVHERTFDADGTGTTNGLPDYGATSGNAPNFLLSCQGRSDQVAGAIHGISDVRFRMGRYDVNGTELPTT